LRCLNFSVDKRGRRLPTAGRVAKRGGNSGGSFRPGTRLSPLPMRARGLFHLPFIVESREHHKFLAFDCENGCCLPRIRRAERLAVIPPTPVTTRVCGAMPPLPKIIIITAASRGPSITG